MNDKLLLDASVLLTRDLARKCGDDVSAAIHRSLSLCDDRSVAIAVVVSAVVAALGPAAGVFDVVEDVPVGTTSLRAVADGVLLAMDEFNMADNVATAEAKEAGAAS